MNYFRFDMWSNELVVVQLSVGMDMRKGAEDIVGILYQKTTGKDRKLKPLSVCCSDTQSA